jgi:hypothetical protein
MIKKTANRHEAKPLFGLAKTSQTAETLCDITIDIGQKNI